MKTKPKTKDQLRKQMTTIYKEVTRLGNESEQLAHSGMPFRQRVAKMQGLLAKIRELQAAHSTLLAEFNSIGGDGK